MGEWLIPLIMFSLGLTVIVGAVCGIVARFGLRGLSRQLSGMETRVRNTERAVRRLEAGGPPAAPSHEQDQEKPPEPARPVEPVVPKPAPLAPPPIPPPQVAAAHKAAPARSLEMVLGTKWLGWVGMVFFLISVALGLKYAYDNNYIGPAGRLAIGVLAGVAALGLGEYFRRRDWNALFQTFTGGGIAIFYVCLYFSFEVYRFTGPGVSMTLASLVTVGAVVMAVGHDAVAIAVLALIGGFLSPLLLSTGENHPYALFTYIAIVDVVALAAAYFRRWRLLDLLAFVGTAALYAAWFARFYGKPDQPSQLAPAMLFTTLFYLMFLLIPTFHSLARRRGDVLEGLVLVVLNALLSFASYYSILYEPHRQLLGFVVLGQALVVFLLFQTWTTRLGPRTNTGRSLLIIALALVTVAVPIQLRLYGIPLAWAVEGALFVYLGLRFQSRITRVAGLLALLLAAGMLLEQLPLHKQQFALLFNMSFGSWAAVVAACALAARLLLVRHDEDTHWNVPLGVAAVLLGFALGGTVLSLELIHFWRFAEVAHPDTYRADSLVVLWALIAGLAITVLQGLRLQAWTPLALGCYALGVVIFLAGLPDYDHPSTYLILNNVFLSRAVFLAALWWGGRKILKVRDVPVNRALEALGHALLALLMAFECVRWAEASNLVSDKMDVSLISAAWAVQAFALIWFGLATRSRTRRYLGFVLFALTVGKVSLIDTATLEKVYRIVSFMASGVFLLAAATFYHRYTARLLGEQNREDEP